MDKLLAGRKVLVVEDEMLVLLMIQDMLADLGCDAVTSAATSAQAIALIDQQSFDLAMLDMNLNGDRSYLVADMLAARQIPFAFATGYGRHDIGESHSDRPVLSKPFQYEELVAVFSGLLAR